MKRRFALLLSLLIIMGITSGVMAYQLYSYKDKVPYIVKTLEGEVPDIEGVSPVIEFNSFANVWKTKFSLSDNGAYSTEYSRDTEQDVALRLWYQNQMINMINFIEMGFSKRAFYDVDKISADDLGPKFSVYDEGVKKLIEESSLDMAIAKYMYKKDLKTMVLKLSDLTEYFPIGISGNFYSDMWKESDKLDIFDDRFTSSFLTDYFKIRYIDDIDIEFKLDIDSDDDRVSLSCNFDEDFEYEDIEMWVDMSYTSSDEMAYISIENNDFISVDKDKRGIHGIPIDFRKDKDVSSYRLERYNLNMEDIRLVYPIEEGMEIEGLSMNGSGEILALIKRDSGFYLRAISTDDYKVVSEININTAPSDEVILFNKGHLGHIIAYKSGRVQWLSEENELEFDAVSDFEGLEASPFEEDAIRDDGYTYVDGRVLIFSAGYDSSVLIIVDPDGSLSVQSYEFPKLLHEGFYGIYMDRRLYFDLDEK